VLASSSTEAVNGSQLFVTNQMVAAQGGQITNLTNQVAAINTDLSSVRSDVSTLFDLRKFDRRDTRQGVASAIAMAQAPIPSEVGGVGYAVNAAVFRGEYAVGGSVSYRLNTSSPTVLTMGFSYAGNKNNGARVGIAGEF
jgi:autotransporter adhesin